MHFTQDFSAKLSAIIQRQGIRKKDLADAVGVHPVTISRWLNGSITPSASTYEKLAELLPGLTFSDTERIETTLSPLEYLRAAVKKAGGIAAAAKRCGIHKPEALSAALNNGATLHESMARALAKGLGLDFHRLMSGADEPPSVGGIHGVTGARPDIKTAPGIRAKYVPLISMAQAGHTGAHTDEAYQRQAVAFLNVTDSRAIAVTVEGDSMAPHFMPGDYILLYPSSRPRTGGVVVAKTSGGEVMLKLYQKLPDNRVQLTSYNPLYAPLIFPEQEVEWIYPVAQHTRNLEGNFLP